MKRVILSQIASLFDPLGLLGPIIVAAKIFLQKLWKLHLTWDDSIPSELAAEWIQIYEELPLINQLVFPRQICVADPVNIQLHGFADASEAAYGACIFFRSVDASGTHSVKLVCFKTRVAPLKQISLPKLELCAAVLLARLYSVVHKAFKLKFDKIVLWSDSTIVLQWINMSPHRLKSFVANRITEIQQLTETCEWRHVPSLDNPADLASKGLSPKQFVRCTLWNCAPSWLAADESAWPENKFIGVGMFSCLFYVWAQSGDYGPAGVCAGVWREEAAVKKEEVRSNGVQCEPTAILYCVE
ncbi:hypothetical protein DMN91_011749 [Ooceraea biroi]|uniref:Uncharacterized protein n=1 Tax=Ooceraea biroi TaxID=2015173 RepID=A0A3L8D6Z6_OOCBI|nr:hypothetical protein DMN91_011749 [Ooceraea biroi]